MVYGINYNIGGQMNWELKKRIGERYRHQWQFAQDVGVCETIVSKVIQCRRHLSREQQKKWADVLQCKTKDIFADEG
jgi:hypothetical protein